jgi:hypothetical protein
VAPELVATSMEMAPARQPGRAGASSDTVERLYEHFLEVDHGYL